MSNSKTHQVFVDYRDPVTPTSPIKNRTYTMTHSDETGDLFVTIALDYATDQTNETQDQVYLQWTDIDGAPLLYGEVLVDGKNIKGNADIRNQIFKRELPLALQAIYVADQPFFVAHPSLMQTPILIRFKSSNPRYDQLYSYGVIGDYQTRYKSH